MEIVTITEARRRLRGALSSSQKEIETVSPETAVGRITAKDMTAAHPYPPYRKSPFDGYAICSHDQKTYDVVATIGAGLVYDGPVLPGQAPPDDRLRRPWRLRHRHSARIHGPPK